MEDGTLSPMLHIIITAYTHKRELCIYYNIL